MKKLIQILSLFALVFSLGFSTWAQEEKTSVPEGSLKIKEFIKDFNIKITRKDLLAMIDTLSKMGKISKSDAEKARKEISAMSDDQFEASTKKAMDSIPDNMTLDDAKDPKKAAEKIKSKTP